MGMDQMQLTISMLLILMESDTAGFIVVYPQGALWQGAFEGDVLQSFNWKLLTKKCCNVLI